MITCSHGYAMLCPQCPKEAKLRDRERVRAGTHVYAVFAWRGDDRYRLEHAVGGKRYRRAAAAERYCARVNAEPAFTAPEGFVVRLVEVPKAPLQEGGEKPTTLGAERVTGTVLWWNEAKGFGFIQVPGYASSEVFAHYTAIEGDGYKILRENQRVSLRVVLGPKGPQAVEIQVEGIPKGA